MVDKATKSIEEILARNLHLAELGIPSWAPPLQDCNFYGLYSAHLEEGAPHELFIDLKKYYHDRLQQPTHFFTEKGLLNTDLLLGELVVITYKGPNSLGIQAILENSFRTSEGTSYLYRKFAASTHHPNKSQKTF